MSRYFLVDFENVSDDGLTGFQKLTPEDAVIVLYTDKALKIRIDFVEMLGTVKERAAIRFMQVESGNQALDMQLATFLGSMIPGEDGGNEFVIVSKDKGYNHIIQFWKMREPNVRISLRKSILDALKPAEEAEEEEEPAVKKPASGSRNKAGRKPVTPSVPKTLSANAPEKKAPEANASSKGMPAPKMDAKKKPVEKKSSDAPENENGGRGQEKTRLNAAIQHILSEAKYDTAIIAFVASFAVKLYGQENAKRSTYTGIIKQYGQKEGLQIYNLIKKEL